MRSEGLGVWPKGAAVLRLFDLGHLLTAMYQRFGTPL